MAVKDDSLWVYIDGMCSSVRNYTSCHDLLESHSKVFFFAIFVMSTISINNDIEATSRTSNTSQQDSVDTLLTYYNKELCFSVLCHLFFSSKAM